MLVRKETSFRLTSADASVMIRDEVGATCDLGQDLKTHRVIENGNAPNTGATNDRAFACSD